MLAQTRYDHILKKLEESGSVTVNEISSALGVSPETVRRDLIMLETHGKLKRVFGGAVASSKHGFEKLSSRLDLNRDRKAELAEYAVSFIDDGDIIAVESGSTAVEFAKALSETDLNIIIITNSNTVFNILKDKFRTVLTGGEYLSDDDCFAGSLAEEFLRRFHVNKSFICPAALSLEHGIECFIPKLETMQLIMTEISDKTFVLADSDKFLTRGLIKTLDLDPEFIYITDKAVEPSVKEELVSRGFFLVSEEQ